MPDIGTNWGVLPQVQSMDPPIWLWTQNNSEEGGLALSAAEQRKLVVPSPNSKKAGSGPTSREEIIQRHWHQFVDILNGDENHILDGYEQLTRLRDQINSRISRLGKRQEVVEDRIGYLALLFEKHINYLIDEMDEHPRWPMTLRVGGLSIRTISGWRENDEPVDEVFGEIVNQHAAAITLSASELNEAGINPENLRGAEFDLYSDEAVREKQVQSNAPPNKPSDIDEPVDYDYGGTPVTWQDSLEEMIDAHQSCGKKLTELSRAVDLLKFRRAVLENVLYRFEMLGRVQKLSADELTGFRDDIPVEYAEEILETGENLGADKGRQAILKKAAENLNIPGSEPYRNLKNELGDLYPQKESRGKPTKDMKRMLAEKLIENCRGYVYIKKEESV